jgi:hypothetical protein
MREAIYRYFVIRTTESLRGLVERTRAFCIMMLYVLLMTTDDTDDTAHAQATAHLQRDGPYLV